MVMELRRVEEAPRPGPRWPIIRLKGGQAGLFQIFSHRVRIFASHWNGKRSQPCTVPQSECAGCLDKLPNKYKGYLHVRSVNTDVEGFLELTPTAIDSMKNQTPGVASVRGMRVEVRRTRGDQGRLSLVMLPVCCSISELPPERDPEDTLRQLWTCGVNTEVLTQVS